MLTGKQVLVVAIHSLGGSRANWHHTPNPQPGASKSTQYEDSQATSNPLVMPFVISHGVGSKPLTIHRSEPENKHHSLLNDPAAPSHLGVGKTPRVTKETAEKHDHQVPLDELTQINVLGCSQSH